MKKLPIFIQINQIIFMIIVTVKNEKSLEQSLKQYKFKVYKTKQIQKLQERQEYKKPSVKRRAQIKKAQYKQKNQISS
jgi:small subunit ribosomal protein S21